MPQNKYEFTACRQYPARSRTLVPEAIEKNRNCNCTIDFENQSLTVHMDNSDTKYHYALNSASPYKSTVQFFGSYIDIAAHTDEYFSMLVPISKPYVKVLEQFNNASKPRIEIELFSFGKTKVILDKNLCNILRGSGIDLSNEQKILEFISNQKTIEG